MDNVLKLKYKVVFASSSDENEGNINELSKPPKQSQGWISGRFSKYPQFIFIKFNYPVHLIQINILMHEKKIPSKIDIYTYFPTNEKNYYNDNFFNFPYENIGYIKLDTNTRNNFMSREFKKISIDINCYYMKLELSKNHINRYNIFQQVGLISIEFYGNILKSGIDNFQLITGGENENKKEVNDITDDDLENICGEKLNMLKEKSEKALEEEKYEESKEIKDVIQIVRSIGKEIYYKEIEKLNAVKREDFDTAIEIKADIAILKEKIANANIKQKVEEDKKDNYNSDKENKDNQIDGGGDENQQDNNEDESPRRKDEKDNNISHNNISNISIHKQNNQNQNTSREMGVLKEEDFQNYDDIVIPTLRNKDKEKDNSLYNINNSNSNNHSLSSDEGNSDGIEPKGELEELDKNIIHKYSLLIPYIGEEGLAKLFSKQLYYKEEGFNLLQQKLSEIFVSKDNHLNEILLLLSRMIERFLDEKKPNTILHSFSLIHDVINCVNLSNNTETNLNNFLSNSIYNKINLKLGDSSTKIRKGCIELYNYILNAININFNDLMIQLLKNDVKNAKNPNISPPSAKITLSKLQIIKSQFSNLALYKESNTEQKNSSKNDDFLPDIISDFLIINVVHSKTEIRKISRILISKYITFFRVNSIWGKLQKLNPKELIILRKEIPDLDEFIKNIEIIAAEKEAQMNSRENSKNLNSLTKKHKGSRSNNNSENCSYCQAYIGNKDVFKTHKEQECLLFTKCPGCSMNLEVKRLNNHILYECQSKANYKMCKRCKEPILNDKYTSHCKENRCNPAKNINSSNRCPLCHKDIPPTDKGFYTHLMVDGCECQYRKKTKYK